MPNICWGQCLEPSPVDSVSMCFDTLEVTTHTVDADMVTPQSHIMTQQSHIPGVEWYVPYMATPQQTLDTSLKGDITLEISAEDPSEGIVLGRKTNYCPEQSEQAHKSNTRPSRPSPNNVNKQCALPILPKYDSNGVFLDSFLQTKTKNKINIEYKNNNIHNMSTTSGTNTADACKITNMTDFDSKMTYIGLHRDQDLILKREETIYSTSLESNKATVEEKHSNTANLHHPDISQTDAHASEHGLTGILASTHSATLGGTSSADLQDCSVNTLGTTLKKSTKLFEYIIHTSSGRRLTAMLDTGASMTLISEAAAQHYTTRTVKALRANLASTEADKVPLDKVVDLKYKIGNFNDSYEFLVFPHLRYDVILGLDWLQCHNPGIPDWGSGIMT